jgi:pimeloyl-ACP methyl ester carboxylesterase
MSVPALPRHRQLTVGNVDVHVAEAGDAGPAVLLLHGNPDTHAVWSYVIARLAPGHRCIAPDLPGFGGSRAPDDFDCSLANHAAFVAALADALALGRQDRFHLVVHDIGGPYGLAFATEHPERLASITIFNTLFSPDFHWHTFARMWRTRGLGWLSMALANRPMFVRELLKGSPRMPREYADHAYAEFRAPAKRMVLRWYRAMDPEVYAGWDERLRDATARTPKRVVWGDLDPFLPPTMADKFGGEVRHVTDGGHHVMVEDPALAADTIAELVRQSS